MEDGQTDRQIIRQTDRSYVEELASGSADKLSSIFKTHVKKKGRSGRAWWCTPLISPFWRQRRVDLCKLEASLA